ncbi:MAG: hypothetical protein R3F56_05615 [Planctomycetota bacterium]
MAGCSGSGGGASGVGGGGSAALVSVESGALVDVYGLRRTTGGSFTASLFQRDVLIGSDIVDERDGATRTKKDNEILYDFLSANPDNLQPRLLITREIGSDEFNRAYDALDNHVRRVTPGRFGQNTNTTPFTVVPRNGALRMNFSRDLGVDDSFFYVLENGQIAGVKNPEAVQLLRIVGDPNDADPVGDFEVVPSRLVARGSQIIIDPVLLGSEGTRLQASNSAGGLPGSPDQVGANIRLAIAIEGPLAIPAIKRDLEASEIGLNNNRAKSIVRDFRSGNENDESAEISRGFRRDPVPPRLVGEMLMYLERVEEVDAFSQLLTIYKSDVRHRIDAGDALRIVAPDSSGTVIATTEIIGEPNDRADSTHVVVLVRREEALSAADPSKLPGYPSDRNLREPWLILNAPRSVLVAEYQDGDGVSTGDDPQYFVRFSPGPIPDANGNSVPTRNISPFAAAIVRFSKPVNLSTVRAMDTFYFATIPLAGAQAEDYVRSYLEGSDMEPSSFEANKFATPHLVPSARFDEDGSQTTVRLQPPYGFYFDHTKMNSQVNERFYTYWLHLIGGREGIKDLAGNQLDFQPDVGRLLDAIVIDFTLDVRESNGAPLFPDNRVVSISRRFRSLDEDEQPSYHREEEIITRANSQTLNEKAYPLPDLFGAVNYIDGRLYARASGRISKVADDLNQQPPPSQDSDLRWCPERMSGEGQVASNSAAVRFGAPIQNPLNPYGCRLQTVWREIDLSLSRVDPFDFNLDVEEVHWAPHSTSVITFDEFDRMSLYLGHSEFRAENCVGATSSLPDAVLNSGLSLTFQDNYVHDVDLRGAREPNGPRNPAPHVGYEQHYVVIDAAMAFTEPNNVNRYMPLPPLEKPYFVWRDETVLAQGGRAGLSSDVNNSRRTSGFEPYIISPFLMGGGRYATKTGTTPTLVFNPGRWINGENYNISTANRNQVDRVTDGLVGAIALPLLGDFQMYPDDVNLPDGRGYVASGANGWQVSLAIQSSSVPNFRVYSGGSIYQGRPRYVNPGSTQWNRASGGLNPINGNSTTAGDNTFYWAQWDFLKRQSVVTFGFVDVINPHRVDPDFGGQNPPAPYPFHDPRLGPYFDEFGASAVLPLGVKPQFAPLFEPPLSEIPGGTEVIPQYRAASIVHPKPWVSAACTPLTYWSTRSQEPPDYINFPLDPLKAGDAQNRKYEDSTMESPPRQRNFWTYPYNLHVTDYVDDPNRLTNATFLSQYAGPFDSFQPNDVRYFNWRLVMKNNVDATPAVSPSIESFAMIYRLESN